jgi:hypothetical protein
MNKSYMGFYYLEILISLLLTQWLVSGVLMTQIKAMRVSANASYHAIAMNVGDMVAERYLLSEVVSEQFIESMKQYLKDNLPSGDLQLIQDNEAINLEIYWNGMNHQACHENVKGESGCYRMMIATQKYQKIAV